MSRLQVNFLSKKILLIGFAALALTGCGFEIPGFPTASDEQADPAAAPTDAAANPNPAVSPSPGASPGASPAAAQVIRCETPNYFADLAFQGGQAQMTFVRKPNTASLDKAATTRTDNPDGSVTFAAGGEGTFYARVYPNASCLLQTVANGAVGIEESGRIR